MVHLRLLDGSKGALEEQSGRCGDGKRECDLLK